MKAPSLNPRVALFCQGAIVCAGLAALALLLVEPHFEGRNAHATAFEVYFKDPFLAYVYVGSIPFFMALQRAFRLFGDVKRTGRFSAFSVEALRAIRRCALTLLGFVAGAAIFIVLFGDKEDRPPGIVMSGLAILGAATMAVVTAKLGRRLQGAVERANGDYHASA